MGKEKKPSGQVHEELEQIRQDMHKFFLQQISLRQTTGYFAGGKWLPPTDVYETTKHFVIVLELAGINKKEITITLENRKLSISGIRKEKSPHMLETYYQVEINYGPFERVILLPEYLEPSSIVAEYENGFLTITIEKQSFPSKAKNIHINIT